MHASATCICRHRHARARAWNAFLWVQVLVGARHPGQGGLDMAYEHVTLIAFLRECDNVDRVYRDARSRTRDRTGAEMGASLS